MDGRKIKKNKPLATSSDAYRVIWSDRDGAKCPHCGLGTFTSSRSMPYEDNIKFRYHRCRGCGKNFSSVFVDANCWRDSPIKRRRGEEELERQNKLLT